MLINPSTPISQLRDAGIVPDWMYRDCDIHGMSEAENILCEWDWDWNWDLGDGYSKQQIEVLAEVRKTIRDGILEYEANPVVKQQEKEKREFARMRDMRVREYQKKYSGVVFQGWIEWLVDYELKYNELPYFFFICTRFIWWSGSKLTPRNKVRALLAGIGVPEPLSIDEVLQQMPEFNRRQIAYLSKKPFKPKGRLEEYASKIDTQLPDRPMTEDDPFWAELIKRQNLYRITPIQLMRMVAFICPDFTIVQESGKPTLMRY